ncbi:MAG: hypothetical protein DI586_08175 [Micavibrio aeruginosavorus]|uniref:Uncharacterized protein n=1 Tax=Micavibrio aeruginosavorus TaxID=349221 RepID=A0A2W5FJ55_9BACT|nr:MAG: hypothetical protein DI586_08175 [Micavibrio aeruginosavorus]
MPEFNMDEPYVDIIRRALGKVFVAEDIRTIFFNIAAQCPQVIEDRPGAQRHENIEFASIIASLQREQGLSRSEVENIIVKNPYLLFESLEETPVERKKKKLTAHYSNREESRIPSPSHPMIQSSHPSIR